MFCLLRVRVSRRSNPRPRFLASTQRPSIHGSTAIHAVQAPASVTTHRLPSHALPTARPRLPHALPHRADADGRSPQSLHPLAQLHLAASPPRGRRWKVAPIPAPTRAASPRRLPHRTSAMEGNRRCGRTLHHRPCNLLPSLGATFQ
jgi:hypothetical protein